MEKERGETRPAPREGEGKGNPVGPIGGSPEPTTGTPAPLDPPPAGFALPAGIIGLDPLSWGLPGRRGGREEKKRYASWGGGCGALPSGPDTVKPRDPPT